MADIGANTLFLSAYYGLSLLWDEYAATGSTDMKFVPYDGTSVSFRGNGNPCQFSIKLIYARSEANTFSVNCPMVSRSCAPGSRLWLYIHFPLFR